MIHHFTASDIAATIVAFALFGLVIVVPGYVLGALLRVFAFDRRTLPARIAVSICLSVAVAPIATYLCWLIVPSAPWLLCGVSCVALILVLTGEKSRRGPGMGKLSKQKAAVIAILAGWIVIGTFCLIDIQIGHRLYVPVTSYDYMLRTAITSAIERTGIPPANPYFYPGHDYILRYHYFWYMLCALIVRFGRPLVTARIAVIAGTLWSGIGLVAIIALYSHLFRSKKTGSADKQMLTAVALLSVTGLDILPLVVTFLLSGRFNASSEWWNEPVLSWVNSVFWQPHSVAALVACITGLLVIHDASRHSVWRVRLSGAVIGGAAFASAPGLSIYISFVFGTFLIVWFVILLFRRRRLEAGLTCLAGILALAMSIPYLRELAGNGPGSAKVPIEFAVRSFYLAEAFTGSGSRWLTTLVNALSLPLNYFLEFGFFFAVGIRQWRKIRHQPGVSDEDACGIAMLATSLLICTFLRSTSISNNDLGWRAVILAQFVLLIWAAELWDNGIFLPRKTAFSLIGAMLALGLAATIYDVTMLRIYPVLLDDLAIPRYHWLAPDRHLGDRTYALREVYERLDREMPQDAVVQQNPDTNPGDLFYGLYANRQTAADTGSCGIVFGGSAALCQGIIKPIRELFNRTDGLNSRQADLICQNLSISALIVKDTDDVWKNKNSWIWTREPVIANAYARAFLCGSAEQH